MKQKKISDRCVSNGENIASGNYEFDRVLRREKERERERELEDTYIVLFLTTPPAPWGTSPRSV